jgi:hypothetical protein
MEMISDPSFNKSVILSDYFISSLSSTNSIEIEKKDYNIEILLSSVCGEIPINLEILY